MNIRNSLGLSVDFQDNGSVGSIAIDPIRISLKASNPFSASGANLWLRKRTDLIKFTALTGPGSNSRFKIEGNTYFASGSWAGLDYKCTLQLSARSLSWQWSVEIENNSDSAVEADMIFVQDVGLKPVNSGLINEYYVSQYLERSILEDNRYGSVVCCRQNMREAVGNPWVMIACRNRATAASVDGMQFFGRTYRETGLPEGLKDESLGGEYSGESSVVALQEKPFKLPAGGKYACVFAATYLADHPEATSENDLKCLPDLFSEFENAKFPAGPEDMITPARNIFNTAEFLPVDDLTDQELKSFFGAEMRQPETDAGRLLSFFCKDNEHVMLRLKETLADRPHGHIMQAEAGYVPDESIVSTTSFAYGVFNSHLSQGNTNFNVLLSICSSQFNLSPETGQRIFVTVDGRQYLLGVPSAFEMGLNHCRWIYKHKDNIFQVRTWTSKKAPQVNTDFRVITGESLKLLITHHFDDLNGWSISPAGKPGEFAARPAPGSMITGKFPHARFRMKINSCDGGFKACGDEALYDDFSSHGSRIFVLDVNETSQFCMSFLGEVCESADFVAIENADNQWLSECHDAHAVWQNLGLNLSLKGQHDDIAAIREILPWYGMNALIHYLTPYGLEQFSGAAWGTRDVAQGPFDLLLCMGKYEEARKVLCIIFSNQNPDGGWPQWWMFDSYSDIRAGSAHGDVVYWCIIALSKYITVTGNLTILDEILPFYQEKGRGDEERQPLSEHVGRLIKMITDSFIPGTALVPFGGGDWNDSLQPVSKELAQRMISSWTVEMNYQAFKQYRKVYERAGDTGKAAELKAICNRIRVDFNRHLMKDGIVAGYGLVEEDDTVSLLLHPSDNRTGIHYSILPMNRGIISGIFSKTQAREHQDLIEVFLKGPDGARLMDRPLKYRGGIQTFFQRAESSTFFGREIGLMYVHEHIRYAEALACTGKADDFMKALRQAIPVGYRDVVPCGDIRQSNCYYSSSDVAFRNRYEADDLYDEILTGRITLRGGWRVYSSGPGIFIGIIVTRLLGLRLEYGNVIIDPVIPHSLDGFSASLDLMGGTVTFNYAVKDDCFSPKSVIINGTAVRFTHEENKYRRGGAVIPAYKFASLLKPHENIVDVRL
jgi:1,2-beta-oligoglucan phosphorylase